MSSAGQWEVVKSNRKHVNNKNVLNNASKQKNKNNLPTMQKNLPTAPILKESETRFKAFLEQDSGDQDPLLSNGTKVSKNKSKSQKKKEQAEKKAKKITCIEDALGALSSSELEQVLSVIQARFPNQPEIWLKDLCRHLNQELAFDPAPADPVFSDKSSDYPLCSVPLEVYQLLLKTLESCPSHLLTPFLEYCLVSLAHDMAKDIPTYGYRLFIQCLLKLNPSLIINVLPKCRDLKNSFQNRHSICLSVLWAAGQAGFHDLDVGLKVWLELMMSLTGVKAFNKYVVSYLDSLLRFHQDRTTSCTSLGVKELFSVLDFMHSTQTSGPSQQLILKGLNSLYPKLKKLSYGPNPLFNYFPSYLLRLKPSASPALKNELLASLMECLTLDVHCYSAWRQLYTKHLVQSSFLLQHIVKKWNSLPKHFPKKHLLETVKAFQLTNDEFMTSKKSKIPDGLSKCIGSCETLLGEMSSQGKFPWGRILQVLIFVSMLLFVYDVFIHEGFHHSKSGKFLHEVGALSASRQAWIRLQVYTNVAYKWSSERLAVALEVARPSLEWAWDQLAGVRSAVWIHSESLRTWCSTNIPPLVKSSRETARVLGGHLFRYGKEILTVLQFNFRWLQKYILGYLDSFHTQLLAGGFSPEHLHRHTVNALSALQHYIGHGFHWVASLIPT